MNVVVEKRDDEGNREDKSVPESIPEAIDFAEVIGGVCQWIRSRCTSGDCDNQHE